MPYQVKDWDSHFENYKSRSLNRCNFLCVPNKQDGLGLSRILMRKDGAAIYGIWNLIIGALSRQPKPRDGWLTDNGKPDGRAWTPEDLALRWRRQRREIDAALEVLCSEAVGWMVSNDGYQVDTVVSTDGYQIPLEGRKEGRKEGKTDASLDAPKKVGKAKARACVSRLVGKGKDAPSGQPLAARPAELSGLELYETDTKLQTGWDKWWAAQQAAFPYLDLKREIQKAHAWEISNPPKRKKNRKAFLSRWFARTQDGKGGQFTVEHKQINDQYAAANRKRVDSDTRYEWKSISELTKAGTMSADTARQKRETIARQRAAVGLDPLIDDIDWDSLGSVVEGS